MDKKGLGGMVTNVLLVLIVVASISIIGFAVLKGVNSIDTSVQISECKNLNLGNEEGYKNCIVEKYGVERASEILGEKLGDDLDKDNILEIPSDGVECRIFSQIDENTCIANEGCSYIPDETYVCQTGPVPLTCDQAGFGNSFSQLTCERMGCLFDGNTCLGENQVLLDNLDMSECAIISTQFTGAAYSPGQCYGNEPNYVPLKIDVEYESDACFTFNQKGLVAYYCFDGDFNDSSGMRNHGTGYNNITFDRMPTGNIAAKFDGKDDYVQVKPSKTLEGEDLTFSFWIKINKSSTPDFNQRTILSKSNVSMNTLSDYSKYDYRLFLGRIKDGGGNLNNPTYQGKMKFYVINGIKDSNLDNLDGSMASTNFDSNNSDDNHWHMITITRGLRNSSMYLDGNLLQFNDFSGFGINDYFNSNSSMFIGSYPYGKATYETWTPRADNYLNGTLDELMIYNRTLTPAEVKNLYSEQKNKFWNYNFNPNVMHYELFMDLSEPQRGLAIKDITDLYNKHKYWIGEYPLSTPDSSVNDVLEFLNQRWDHTTSLYSEELDLKVKYGLMSSEERDQIISIYEPIWSAQKESQYWYAPLQSSSNSITGMVIGDGDAASCPLDLWAYQEPWNFHSMGSEGPNYPLLSEDGSPIGSPEKLRTDFTDFDIHVDEDGNIISEACAPVGVAETFFKFREFKATVQTDGFSIKDYYTVVDRHFLSDYMRMYSYGGPHNHILGPGSEENAPYNILKRVKNYDLEYVSAYDFDPDPSHQFAPALCTATKDNDNGNGPGNKFYFNHLAGQPDFIKVGLDTEYCPIYVTGRSEDKVQSAYVEAAIVYADALGQQWLSDAIKDIETKSTSSLLSAGCEVEGVSVSVKIKPFDRKCVLNIDYERLNIKVTLNAKAIGKNCAFRDPEDHPLCVQAGFSF